MLNQFDGFQLNSFNSLFEILFGVLIVFSTILRNIIGPIRKRIISLLLGTKILDEISIVISNVYIEGKNNEGFKSDLEYPPFVKAIEKIVDKVNYYTLLLKKQNVTLADKENNQIKITVNNKLIEEVTKAKFHPIFEFVIMYTFIVLLLSGIDDENSSIYTTFLDSHDKILNFDSLVFTGLIFLNLFSLTYIFILFFRRYRGKKGNLKRYKLNSRTKKRLQKHPKLLTVRKYIGERLYKIITLQILKILRWPTPIKGLIIISTFFLYLFF
ncbi:MAG: hypothetical protein IPP61_09990 [Cytophagaceae bacterium]|nr:hypothetical protein [Cytophagaceae bacterium]